MMRRLVLSAALVATAGIAAATPEDRDAQPINPPVPSYPLEAAMMDLPGACFVRFDVDVEGLPVNITATCTDEIFCSESKRAISRVFFAPKIVDGEPVMRTDVVYPLEYQLEVWDSELQRNVPKAVKADAEQLPCEPVAVS